MHAGVCGKSVHRQYSCPHCNYTSSSLASFTKHKSSHGENAASFHCKLCGHQCSKAVAFKRHLEFCLDLKSAYCPVCGRKSVSDSVRNLHMMSHVKVYRYECKSCLYRCRRFIIFWGHLKKRHPNAPLWCHVCKKVISKSPWCASQSPLALEVARTQYARHLREHFPLFVNLTRKRVRRLLKKKAH